MEHSLHFVKGKYKEKRRQRLQHNACSHTKTGNKNLTGQTSEQMRDSWGRTIAKALKST